MVSIYYSCSVCVRVCVFTHMRTHTQTHTNTYKHAYKFQTLLSVHWSDTNLLPTAYHFRGGFAGPMPCFSFNTG